MKKINNYRAMINKLINKKYNKFKKKHKMNK